MISIVIPTYNERENIATIIEQIDSVLGKSGIIYEVIVVDDASPDGTANAVKTAMRKNRNLRLYTRDGKGGIGSAYKFAIPKARGDYVIEMDADLSHNPKHLPELIAASKTADVVVGSRNISGGKRKDSLTRQFFPAIGALLFRVAGCPVKDPTSGFRIYRKWLVDRVGLEKMPDDYSFQVAMLFESKRIGAVIREIPIEFEPRKAGRTKYSKKELVGNLKLLFRVIAGQMR